jgi:hypothetical protein
MEKLVLISQAVSLSVIFYVVTYFLITWQWPESLLSLFLSTFFLYLFLLEDTSHTVQNPLIYSLPLCRPRSLRRSAIGSALIQ